MNTVETFAAFDAAVPFPHVVAEVHGNWLDVCDLAEREFPGVDDPRWHTFHGEREEGKQEGRAEICGPEVARIHEHLASLDWIRHLRSVTGIPDLVADPERIGGGVHQARRGGRLAMHTDFTIHPTRPGLERRVNVLLFLTREYRQEWGGCLELGVHDTTRIQVHPRMGRLVIFAASPKSWHGHPRPWDSDTPRRSIPAYYYAPRRTGVEATSTVWWGDQ